MLILSMKSKVVTLSRWMTSIMSTLKMWLMLIMFVRRTKLSAKNKVILMMHQLLTVQWRLRDHKVVILQMMATSLIRLILLRILVMLISSLMVDIITISQRVPCLLVNWLLPKPTFLELENNRV